MRGLPEQHRLVFGSRRGLLCHGSPRRVNEFLWESTSSDAFLDWLCERHAAEVVVCTHTGIPWHRALPSGRHVINAGVIGRPANDGDPGGPNNRHGASAENLVLLVPPGTIVRDAKHGFILKDLSAAGEQ